MTHLRIALFVIVAGGIGGLSVFERSGLGINDTETFLTGMWAAV